jgi:hypothetical protein
LATPTVPLWSALGELVVAVAGVLVDTNADVGVLANAAIGVLADADTCESPMPP